ncbi:MAG: S9 family peptidase, partial [Holophagales bacterium]|nr:S9 family peptidase [Holophagales bacterium]
GGDTEEGAEDAEEEEELGQPFAVTADGKIGLYRHHGDLFALDLESSTYRRLTDHSGREEAVRLSPDGSRLAFVRDNDLHTVSVAGGKETRLTHTGTDTVLNGTLTWVYWEELFGRRDRGYGFSPDSSKIAFFQIDEAPVDVMTYVDPRPSATKVIHQRYPKAGTVNPRVRAGVVDLESRDITWIDLGTYPYEYLVRLVWLPSSDGLIVQTLDRAQENLDLFLADAATGRVRHLFRETDEAWIDVHDDLIFLEDGRRFVWVSARDGDDQLFLYELPAPSEVEGEVGARLLRQLTSGTGGVSSGARRGDGLGGAVAAIEEDGEGGGWVYFMGKMESHLENHLYRVALDGEGVERLTRQEGSHRTTWSADGRFFLHAHSSLGRPSSTELRRRDGGKIRTLIEPSHELAQHFEFPRPELLTVKAADGTELSALLAKPKGFEPSKRYPAIVRIYGGPAAPVVSNRWRGSLFEQLLLQEGYVLFSVDPRTSTARGKSVTRGLLKDFYGERETADLLDGVKWLKEQPFVDGERIGITGWSGGGTTTVAAMTRSREFRAGVAGAGVYDWHLYDTIYTERYMKHPERNKEGYGNNNLVEKAGDLHGRLMLIHGTYDDNVHLQNTWNLVDSLIDAGIVFDLVIYPMRKHGFRDDESRLHRDKTLLDFWSRELGGSDGGAGSGPPAAP